MGGGGGVGRGVTELIRANLVLGGGEGGGWSWGGRRRCV